MRIALVNSMPPARHGIQKRLYPLALLKIGAWRKSLGDECKLYRRLPDAGEVDEIWITTVFTFDIPYALGIVRESKNRADVVRVGGVSASLLPEYFEREGIQVHRGLLPEAEQFSPDWSLLNKKPEYSITHTSRGCIRKCRFCMVPRLEPGFQNRPAWRDDLFPGAKTVLFYDNNWLAKERDEWFSDVEELRDIVKSNGVRTIDFNQGLDARILTEEMADALQGLPITPYRFAFDGKQEDKYYQQAIRMMAERGVNKFVSYVLHNFMDTPEDFYYRLRASVELTEELGVKVDSFPMRYQPILTVDPKRGYVGKHWKSHQLKAFMGLLNHHSFGGTVSATTIKEFEYWFGENEKEFVRLLNYPKIYELAKKRKGNLRLIRTRARQNDR